MADQKVSARVSLTVGVDPVNDVLPIVDASAGTSGSKKITINDLFTGWGMTPAGESLAKAASLQAQRDALGISDLHYSRAINGLTGGTPDKLDALPTVNLPVGTVQIVFNYSTTMYVFKLMAGTYAESPPTVVVPDDFDNATNAKAWLLADLSANQIVAKSVDSSVILTATLNLYNDLGANVLTSDSTLLAENTFPSISGRIGLDVKFTFIQTTASATITAEGYIDQTFVFEPVSAVSPVYLILPNHFNARVGQRISFMSDFAVAVFSPQVAAGLGVITGPALTALAANTWYEYVCKSIVGTVTTWKRIR